MHAIFVSISGAKIPAGATIAVNSQRLDSWPSVPGPTKVQANIYFFDVMVQGVSDGTATVTITHDSVKSGTQMQYWNGRSWTDVAKLSVRGNAVSGDIPVSALHGTPIVIGTR